MIDSDRKRDFAVVVAAKDIVAGSMRGKLMWKENAHES